MKQRSSDDTSSRSRRYVSPRSRWTFGRGTAIAATAALALVFALTALWFTLDGDWPDWTSSIRPSLVIAVGALVGLIIGVATLFWPRKAHVVAGRRSLSRRSRYGGNEGIRPRPSPSNLQGHDVSRTARGQYVAPADRWDSAANPSQAVGRPVPASSPEKPARRVELAALTTSGVSGLTVDRGSGGPFDVYAATQVGLQHAKGGYPREDAYAIGGAAEQNWVFLAVADGLGSAENSHAAAQLASQTALTLLHQRVPSLSSRDMCDGWTIIAQDIAAQVAAKLDVASVETKARHLNYISASSESSTKSSPACTLVFAALGPVTSAGYPLLWGSVGDSELLLVDLDSGQSSWLTYNETKQRGGMVSNATRAMPRDHQYLTAGFQFVATNTMTVLASDGMADAIRLEPEQYAKLLPEVAGPSPREWMFGQLVGFDLPGLHDDRTLVAAWPRRVAQSSPHPRAEL